MCARIRQRDPAPRRPVVSGRWSRATLLAALIVAGVPAALSQASPAPADSMERAAALIQSRSFEQAAAMLRQVLSTDPANRRAKEMLAFALESRGDLEGERQVRSTLAARFPDDPRIQTDYGRVLERSGEEDGALRAYRRAREANARSPAPDLDAAIERMRGRTALEVGVPLTLMSDPDATASWVQAGAAVPIGSRYHVALSGSRYAADGRTIPGRTTAGALGLSFVLRRAAGAYWMAGPRLHLVSPRGGAKRDLGVGGAIAGRATFIRSLEGEWRAEVEAPWDESAITVLRGGRTTAVDGRLYSHWFDQRLLLQVGARRRRLSILDADPGSTRRHAVWQSLRVAGADVVVWRKPAAAVEGEILDERMTSPTTMSSAVTVAYRHYDVSTQTTPEFVSIIGLVPRGSVDEGSVATTLASSRAGVTLNAGLARDSARRARLWRAGGTLTWAPKPTSRIALGYEEATEVASGLVGRRREGRVSVHVDL